MKTIFLSQIQRLTTMKSSSFIIKNLSVIALTMLMAFDIAQAQVPTDSIDEEANWMSELEKLKPLEEAPTDSIVADFNADLLFLLDYIKNQK